MARRFIRTDPIAAGAVFFFFKLNLPFIAYVDKIGQYFIQTFISISIFWAGVFNAKGVGVGRRSEWLYNNLEIFEGYLFVVAT
jgi:hypothetical protein